MKWLVIGEVTGDLDQEEVCARQLFLTYQFYLCKQWEETTGTIGERLTKFNNNQWPILLLALAGRKLCVYGGVWTGDQPLVQYLGGASLTLEERDAAGKLLRAVRRFLSESGEDHASVLDFARGAGGSFTIPAKGMITFEEPLKTHSGVFQGY